ncbi:hypothetical protein LTR94_024209, partial [Friedmanniomyces endolithicus]
GAMSQDRERERAAFLDVSQDGAAILSWVQDAGGIGVFQVDMKGVIRPTPEFCRLYGVPFAEEMPATVFEDLVFEEDRALVSNAASRSDGSANLDVQYRIHRLDNGQERWIARRGQLHYDADGRPVRFAGVARDVTEENQAREALEQSEDRYRALFGAIDEGFCIIEFFDGPHGPLSDYVHVVANDGYERHTGIRGIVGRTLRDLAPDQADDWIERYGAVLRTGEPYRFEAYFEQAGRHIEVSAARVEPASRKQVSVLFKDIEARKRAEFALRESEALVRQNIERVQLALSAGAIIGTWVWDIPNDRFTVDEAFAEAFGLDPRLGRDGISLNQIVETVHPDDQAGLTAAMETAIRSGGDYAHQYRVKRADGRFYWIEANGRVDMSEDGRPVRFPGVLLDVEARRAVEAERDKVASELRALNDTLELRVAERTAELMKTEEALRQAQKMEAVGQLTGGLAHDFNNLLAGISGSLELIGNRIAQGRFADVERFSVAAQHAAKRAAALTHRLLAFSRRQTLDPRPTNTNRLVRDMEDLVRRTMGPAIEVEVVTAGRLWSTLVDPHQLENALLNLCINARDAMPNGGRLTVETANRWMDARAAAALDLEPGQYVSLCVSDTGPGMAPEIVERAFDPFFTTKPMGEGTGLGLSMVYGFARQSGGQVRIYSEPGEGAMICIYLPRSTVEADEPETSTVVVEPPKAQAGKTVMVVDDEPTVRMLVTEILHDLGYQAIEAADGASGLKILQSGARIDLLVTDVGLPGGMNGRQLADAARVARPDLKVLFITGYAENAVVGNGQLESGMHVMTKPFEMSALSERIQGLISAD